MRLGRKLIWGVAAALVSYGVNGLSMNATQTPGGGRVEGSVHDNLGAAIASAHVLIRADGAGRQDAPPPDIALRSDAQGGFASDLFGGFYDVCVMSDAFDPVCRKILVRRDQATQAQFILQPNVGVLRQIGERF